MKVSKINSFKILTSLSLSILLLMSSCADSNNKRKTESKVIAPKVSIQTAVMSNNLEIIKQHIEVGTNINVKDQMTGSTPLITAVVFGKTAIVKALIEAKADLSIKNNDGATALHSAAFFCHVEIVQMLVDAKADKTIKNNFGATPRESIMGPFKTMEPIYKMLQQQLEPMGLKIDLADIEKKRPIIAIMLK
ncbi:MAG: ankyrin repeat protein [Porticoccaceae bacterium]|jgi:ankyrin repeat protein